MKAEELKRLKEKFEQLRSKQNEVLNIQKEIELLKESKEVKRYLNLLEILNEKTTGRNTGVGEFTDKEMINIALRYIEITPDEEIYVYLGTYKYNNEIDIVHSSNDISVSRSNQSADYVLYQKLESKYFDSVKIPYTKASEFEKTHKIIIPKNVASRERYFYELQSEYFETMVLKSPEEANEKISKLLKN